MISSAGLYVCATILTFIYLDPSAAAIIIVTLLPLALSPVILRSTMSLGIARNVQTSREESNHVCNVVNNNIILHLPYLSFLGHV